MERKVYLLVVVVCLCSLDILYCGTVELCPPAYIGENYTLYCSANSSSHERFVNWEEHVSDSTSNDSWVQTKSVCKHSSGTASCGQENWTACYENEELLVKHCIYPDTAGAFSQSLTLKEVTSGDQGRIFRCKLLDIETEKIRLVMSCVMDVRNKTTTLPLTPTTFGDNVTDSCRTHDSDLFEVPLAVFIVLVCLVIMITIILIIRGVIVYCYRRKSRLNQRGHKANKWTSEVADKENKDCRLTLVQNRQQQI